MLMVDNFLFREMSRILAGDSFQDHFFMIEKTGSIFEPFHKGYLHALVSICSESMPNFGHYAR
jgi:hypothetical protein